MSEKFTKGPWLIYKHDGHVGNVFTLIYSEDNNTNKNTKIADMPDTYYIDRDNMAEVLANAALIAAAPEMYDMLEEIKEKIDRSARISIGHSMGAGWSREQAKGFFMEYIEINKRIKAVLQKARDKQ